MDLPQNTRGVQLAPATASSLSLSNEREHDIVRKRGLTGNIERTWTQRTSFEIGTCYAVGMFVGLIGGGLVGALRKPIITSLGAKHTANLRWGAAKNMAGRWAPTLANTGGVFAMIHGMSHKGATTWVYGPLANDSDITPMALGAAGFFSSLPRGPLMALGVGVACAGVGATDRYYFRARDTAPSTIVSPTQLRLPAQQDVQLPLDAFPKQR